MQEPRAMWRRARRRSSAPISYGHKAVTEDVRSSHPPLLLVVTVPPPPPASAHPSCRPRTLPPAFRRRRRPPWQGTSRSSCGSIWTTEARHALFFAGPVAPLPPASAAHTTQGRRPLTLRPRLRRLPRSTGVAGRRERCVLMGQKRRPEVHVQVGAQWGTAARDGGARLGVRRGARPGRGGGGVYGRRG